MSRYSLVKDDFTYEYLSLSGEIDISVVKKFEAELHQLIRVGNKNILLDCKGLKYIDSQGLRVLFMLYKEICMQGGRIRLVNISPNIAKLLLITGLYKFLYNSDDIEAKN